MRVDLFRRVTIVLPILCLLTGEWSCSSRAQVLSSPHVAVTYYVDGENGKDQNSGTSENTPWQSLSKVEQTALKPGDAVKFKRGSCYTGPLYIRYSGDADHPILVSDYGDASRPAPCFTNPVFTEGNYGNCIRIRGSYVTVENFHCKNTSAYIRGAYTPSSGWDTTVWEMGAIYIDKNAAHCIVRNNEMENCIVGIKSYGPFARIEHNYVHDCNRVLKEWGWGPIGIWFGADHQEAAYNRIFNYRAEDPRIAWGQGIGGGADGGAFEIDDARYDKSNISIHHNYTRDCQGFLEVTWTDIRQHPVYKGFEIHHNISDDYQQFIALWQGADCKFDNNTIIRRKKNANDWGVFNIAGENTQNRIRNNLIVTELDIQIFNAGLQTPAHPHNIIENNLYFAASGALTIGLEGPGNGAVYGNPLFKNYTSASQPEDFALQPGSNAIDKGQQIGYTTDFFDKPVKGLPDIGAIEKSE